MNVQAGDLAIYVGGESAAPANLGRLFNVLRPYPWGLTPSWVVIPVGTAVESRGMTIKTEGTCADRLLPRVQPGSDEIPTDVIRELSEGLTA